MMIAIVELTQLKNNFLKVNLMEIYKCGRLASGLAKETSSKWQDWV